MIRDGVADPANERTAHRIVPALGRDWLTRAYDPVVRFTTRERRVKECLSDVLAPRVGDRVLDLASGTGTFALSLLDRAQGVRITGLDADEGIIGLACAKGARLGITVPYVRGHSIHLPYPEQSFDAVMSSLFLHHLVTSDKRRTLSEVVRVLRPGGRFVLADWTRGSDPVMRGLSVSIRMLDGFAATEANFSGRLPSLLDDAGLVKIAQRHSFRTIYGTLALFSAERPT